MIEIDPSRPVLIVTTKLAANRLTMLNVPYQVISRGSIANGSEPDWNVFRTVHVDIWPDGGNDERRMMDAVAQALILHQAVVRIVDTDLLEPGVGPAMLVDNDWDKDRILDQMKRRLRAWRPLEIEETIEPPKGEEIVVEKQQEPFTTSNPIDKSVSKMQRRKGGNNDALVVNNPDHTSKYVSWKDMKLTVTDSGHPINNIDNVVKILQMHPKRDERPIWLDSFLQRICTVSDNGCVERWGDAHDLRMTLWIQRKLGLSKITAATVHDGVVAYASVNTRDCLKEWVLTLEGKWDKHERLPSLMVDGFGTVNTKYTQCVGRIWFVSMIARALRPGCQVDTMPVLEGPQGMYKTTALRVLGGDWYTELSETIGTKDFLQCIQGKWLIEIGELHSFGNAAIEQINSTITRTIDNYRASYGRYPQDFPRRCVFAATTNRNNWHGDPSGARRFLPISCRDINIQYLTENREQLFAEAFTRYQRGEVWWDLPEGEAREQQAMRYAGDPWTNFVLDYANRTQDHGVTVEEIMRRALEIPLEKWQKRDAMRVGAILRYAGWTDYAERRAGYDKVVRTWYPHNRIDGMHEPLEDSVDDSKNT